MPAPGTPTSVRAFAHGPTAAPATSAYKTAEPVTSCEVTGSAGRSDGRSDGRSGGVGRLGVGLRHIGVRCLLGLGRLRGLRNLRPLGLRGLGLTGVDLGMTGNRNRGDSATVTRAQRTRA